MQAVCQFNMYDEYTAIGSALLNRNMIDDVSITQHDTAVTCATPLPPASTSSSFVMQIKQCTVNASADYNQKYVFTSIQRYTGSQAHSKHNSVKLYSAKLNG